MATPKLPDANRTHVSPDEFAALRGISLKTVRRYMDAGLLPFVQAVPGGRVLIPIDALTNQPAQPAAPPAPTIETSSPAAASPTPSRRRGPKPKWKRP